MTDDINIFSFAEKHDLSVTIERDASGPEDLRWSVMIRGRTDLIRRTRSTAIEAIREAIADFPVSS